MKNYKKILLFCVLLPLIIGTSFASNVSSANKTKIDNIMIVVERDWGKEPIVNQISKYEKFIKAFGNVSFKDNDQKEMIMYLVECFQKKVNSLKSQLKTQDQVISNVDWDRVQREWLSWHNEERSKKGLSPYTYSDALNYTSLARAQQIASEKREAGSTHIRQVGDKYFPTESIRVRFANLGVKVVDFSESNAYGYYNCKKSDCTQEMINVLKKRFDDVFLNEQHYKAVVSNTYNQIGLGVAINGTYVWITTHYGKNVK